MMCPWAAQIGALQSLRPVSGALALALASSALASASNYAFILASNFAVEKSTFPFTGGSFWTCSGFGTESSFRVCVE